ncbi:MAG: acylphosphatase [Steroidobacteraceae bacterium]
MKVARRAVVSGRVQGVFYRATTVSKARELGVTGSARNLPDGRVEVIAFGAEDAVRKLFDWLWIGSSASHVTAVEEADCETGGLEPDRFSSR